MKFIRILVSAVLLLTSILLTPDNKYLAMISNDRIIVFNGHSIQEAINSANEGQTIFVKNGTYYEQIVVNKSISLFGESADGVVINGLGNTYIINLIANSIKISSFTIMNSSTKVGSCMHVYHASNVFIQDVKVDTGCYGVLFTNVTNTTLFRCRISNTVIGVQLRGDSRNNVLKGNFIVDNNFGIVVDSSFYNVILHNNFINNTRSYWSDGSPNVWDNGYPSGGNFWSDYSRIDQKRGFYQNITGADGLGDFPYPREDDPLDKFPFINPIVVEPYSHDDLIYFLMSSNLTVSTFTFNETEFSVSLIVKGINGSQYFCRLAIPCCVFTYLSTEQWVVKANNNLLTTLLEKDANNFYLIFCLAMSQHSESIKITPKYSSANFPSDLFFLISITLFFLLIFLLYTVLLYIKRKHRYTLNRQNSMRS
jgi:parallel beta-helix repeat protein